MHSASRGQDDRTVTKLCQLRLFWLLPKCFRIRHAFWTGGNHGGVVWAQEIEVAVGDVDRRVLPSRVAEGVGEIGLIICVWVGIGPATRLPPAGALGLLHRLLAMDVVGS